MATSYRTIVAAVGTRVNALVGATATALQASYVTTPLVSGTFQSTIFPFTDIQESVLWAEGRLAQAIADTPNHPLRTPISSTTAALASSVQLPFVGVNGEPIIGAWGAVVDGSSLKVCSDMPLDEVRRAVRMGSTNLPCPLYWFNINGARIEHTRTTVKVECCVYSRTVQAALLAAGNILLSDALEQAYVAGAVSYLVRDDEFMGQAAMYRRYFEETLNSIRQLVTVVPNPIIDIQERASA